MTAVINLSVPWPPSGDKYWRVSRGQMHRSEKAIEYIARLRSLIRPQVLAGEVTLVRCDIYRPEASGDTLNRLKVLEDALEGIAYLNDRQVAHYRGIDRWDTDPSNPRVELVYEGERFATDEEIAEHARKKAEANQKRRATIARNKAARRALQLGATPAVWRPR